MINSISKELFDVEVPYFKGEIGMLPFDLSNLADIPEKFKDIVKKMVSPLPIKEGVAFLTVDGKLVEKGKTQRRGGIHIDGNYLAEIKSWPGSGGAGWGGNGGGNGWKVGEGGVELNSEQHKISYENPNGGMLIVSNYPACKGWNGVFEGKPGIGGDCSGVQIKDEGFILKPNVVYYGNSQFVHESLPIDKTVERVMLRITLPLDYPVVEF